MGSDSNHTQVVRSSAMLLSCTEKACPVWERSTHAKKLDATLNETCRMITRCLLQTHTSSLPQSPNRPIIQQESGGKLYGTDTANYGPKTSTQWTSGSGATPEIAEELHQMHWPHQHDGESCLNGAMERTTRASGRQCAP